MWFILCCIIVEYNANRVVGINNKILLSWQEMPEDLIEGRYALFQLCCV